MITSAITAVFGAVKEFFGFQSRKLELKNSAPVQAAAAAQNEVTAEDKSKQAIGAKDVEEIRRELSE